MLHSVPSASALSRESRRDGGETHGSPAGMRGNGLSTKLAAALTLLYILAYTQHDHRLPSVGNRTAAHIYCCTKFNPAPQ